MLYLDVLHYFNEYCLLISLLELIVIKKNLKSLFLLFWVKAYAFDDAQGTLI